MANNPGQYHRALDVKLKAKHRATEEGIRHSAAAFRRLIDIGIRHGGSYFPTYHRYATRKRVEACCPQFPEFLKLKRKYHPAGVFQSDWYRHYRKMFA